MFDTFEISGTTPAEIGTAFGEYLAPLVHKTWSFYYKWWSSTLNVDDDKLQAYAETFKVALQGYCGGIYAVEIEALAAAAGIEPWKIYCLNSRTEIANAETTSRAYPNECTSVSLPDQFLLAQTWDWAEEALGFTSIVHLTGRADGKPSVAMMVEPGIIAKIGMNSNGVGVALNLLAPRGGSGSNSANDTSGVAGVPVHVLLRVVLDSTDIETAVKSVLEAPRGWATSSVLHITAAGRSAVIELDGLSATVEERTDGVCVRTNHFVRDVTPPYSGSPSSIARFNRANEIIAAWPERPTYANMVDLLSCRAGDLPILRPFVEDKKLQLMGGTICQIFMRLEEGVFCCTRGSPLTNAEVREIKLF